MNKICGIYKITSPSEKIYIGQSINIKHRITEYKNLKCKNQSKLYNSIVRYGWENHTFEIIHECEESELNKLEAYYIKFYDTFNTKHGMNLTSGGNAYKLSDISKEKIRIAQIGNKIWLGKKHTEETKLKMSIAQKNKKASEETKRKMSETRKGRIPYNKGKKHTEETKLKMSIASKGKRKSEEHARNIGNSKRGRKLNDTEKKVISIRMKGKQIRLGAKLSNETKLKIFEKICHSYKIYDNNNKLIYYFKSNFNSKMKELNLPQTSFRKSHQNNNKIKKGKYKNWYVVKL